MSQLSIPLAIILVFASPAFEVSGSKYLQIPLFKTCDFGDYTSLNRNWMEGYYMADSAYIRVYMAVFDTDGYPDHKDIWQDHSGHIVIYPQGKMLWVGFGTPARQILFANKYITDGIGLGVENRPLIRSFLVNAEIITDISKRASVERFTSRGLDLNVDTTKSPNQFGTKAVSTEMLRQNALAHSMVTYYLKPYSTVPEHSAWGRTEDVAVLEQRVVSDNMNREIPQYCDWTVQELFPIEQDISFQGNTYLDNAVKESALYKQLLIRRKVLLALIQAIEEFLMIGGRPYREISSRFVPNVLHSSRLTEKFKLGEDLTKADVQSVENKMVRVIRNNRPSNEADMALWERFQSSVDQVNSFAKSAGTEIKLGNPTKTIKEWNVLPNYQIFQMVEPSPLPKMQLIQDSSNIGIRMDYHGGEDAVTICRLIKNNFIGSQVGNLQLISPLYDSNDIFTYAKRLSDCLEGSGILYTERAIKPALVSIYGTDGLEYRFYPDAQVVWSEFDRGTLLFFERGEVVNLCIKGFAHTVQDVLDDDLREKLPQLYQSIQAKMDNHEDGLIIVPQHYITWPKRGNGTPRCWLN